MSGHTTPPTEEELMQYAASEKLKEIKRQHADKICEQCTLANREITFNAYVAKTRQMRRQMDDKGMKQLAHRWADSQVLLFAAYVCRMEDKEVYDRMQELARNFNKGVIEK